MSHQDAFLRLRGIHAELDVSWTPDARGRPSLTIAYPENAEVFVRAVVWNGLQVSYAAK